MKNIKYASLPIENDFYTIPDTIRIICAGISEQWENQINPQDRKVIYQKIKRELERRNIKSIKSSDRKTTYKREDILSAINGTNIYYDFYCYLDQLKTDDRNKFESNEAENIRIAKIVQKTSMKIKEDITFDEQSDVNTQHLNEPYYDETKELNELKFRCICDILLELFEFDEDLAKHDIPYSHTFEATCATSSDIEAMERLRDISNYYNTELVQKFKDYLRKANIY